MNPRILHKKLEVLFFEQRFDIITIYKSQEEKEFIYGKVKNCLYMF